MKKTQTRHRQDKKRILILYLSMGSGHKKTAEAIEKAINRTHPSWNTLKLDPVENGFPKLKKLVEHFYLNTNNAAPGVYSFCSSSDALYKMSRVFLKKAYNILFNKNKEAIEKFNPDIILITQPFLGGIIAGYNRDRTPTIAIHTDYFAHDYWFNDSISAYTIANERSKDQNICKARVTGIPIDPCFSEKKDKKNLRKKLRLKDMPAVLVMGGGLGIASIEKVIRSLDGLNKEFQIIAVTGLNKRLRKKLDRATFKKEVKILGYVDDVDEYMDAAEILVTKPSGLTIAEAAAKDLPSVFIKGMGGCEEKNLDFLKKAGLRQYSNDELPAIVDRLLSSKKEMNLTKEKMKNIARPNAAFDIVKVIEEVCAR